MSARRWILLTVLTTVVVGGAVATLNAAADVYGLFRDTHGRRLPIYDSERRGKYLLSLHYVPDNFEAILLGSSVTSNWNTGGISVYRTYNESTDGGNISEEKLLAETVLRARDLKAAICIIHPYMTDSHGLNAEEMKPSEIWAALGSTSLLRVYKLRRAVEREHGRPLWDAIGTEEKDDTENLAPLNPVLKRIMTGEGEIHVDEEAFAEYAALVDQLHRRGARVVAVVPPTYEPILAPRRERMDRYSRRVLAIFSPDDLVVDFSGPAYASFRLERRYFRDGVHLSRQGAAEVVKILNQRLAAQHP